MGKKEVTELIKKARSPNKEDKQTAAENLANQAVKLGIEDIQTIEEALRTLQTLSSDKDKRIKKGADDGARDVSNHLARLKEQSRGGGREVPKSQVASRQQEMTPALRFEVKETVRGTLSYQGDLRDVKTEGLFEIKNTGQKDRVFDINFEVPEVGSSEIKKEYHINEVEPQESWKQEYSYEWGGEQAALAFREVINTFPEAKEEEPSNVLVYGKVMQTDLKYIFTSNRNLSSIKMTKKLPAGFSNVSIKSSSSGKPTLRDGMIQWNLENIRQGENGELLVTGSFDVKNLEEISTGSVEVTFDSKEQLFSGVKIAEEDKRTAATRSNYVVESTEREEQPDYWDSKFIYQNSSEFPIKILGVKVSDEKQTYFEISSPVTVPAGNTWESPAWESFSETQPSFNKEVKLTVGSDVTVTSEAILGLEETQLVVANIEGDKIYIGEDGTTISEVPSYRETPIPTQIKIKNIGKITYESLKIDDTTPAHFLPSNPDTVKIIYVDMKGREDELSRSEFDYVSEPSDDNADKDHKGIFTIKRQCDPEGQFRVVYSPRAVRPLPDHEYVSKTHITAVLVKKAPPLELELVEQQPKLTVVHERRRISVGKDVLPGAKPKEYRITIVYTNKGSHSLKAVALRDFVPEEFEFSDDEVTVEMPGAGKEKMDMTSDTSKSTVQDAKGDVREWTFPEIKKDSKIVVTYTLTGKAGRGGHYHASAAQISFT